MQQAENVVSKAEFARRRNVTAGRVSQWISEGKIFGAALVGEGRSARINERLACAQLNRTLDVNQRYGNGLATRLDVPEEAARGPAGHASDGEAFVGTGDDDRPADLLSGATQPPADRSPAAPSVNDQIARERLIQLQRANREAERQAAIDAGQLTDANAVRQQIGREIAKLVSHFEGALANFATAIAAEFKVPQRDALHLLRAEYRKFRASAADEAAQAAELEPETVSFETDVAEDEDAAAA